MSFMTFIRGIVLAIITGCFVTACNTNFGRTVERRDSQGRLEETIDYFNDIMVHSIAYHTNGEKYLEKYYDTTTGLLSGPYFEYYETGGLHRKGNAKNGSLEDTMYVYYED